MTHPGSARETILDAFEDLIREQGERAATLEAVARQAGVSKGGLLYHFGSKQELVAGEIARLKLLAEETFVEIATAPEGAVAHFIRTSEADGTPFDRAYNTIAMLAQSSHELVSVLQTIQQRWLQLIIDAIGDPVVARLVMLMSDGLYYASLFPTADPQAFGHPSPDDILAAVDRLLDTRGADSDN